MHFKKLSFVSIIFLLVLIALPARASSVLFAGKVAADVLYVRQGPGKTFTKVRQLKNGSAVNVYEEKNGWYRIGDDEWVLGEYVKKNASVSSNFNVSVSVPVLKVRSGPGTSFAKVDQLQKGTVVEVTSQKNGWYQLDGEKRWINAEYVKKTTAALTKKNPVPSVAKTTDAAESVAFASDQIGARTASVPKTTVTGSSEKPSADCMTEIKRANKYCISVAKGCPSYSKTPHCIEVNQLCEERQKEALSYCPLSNQ